MKNPTSVRFAAILLGTACWLATGPAATAAAPLGWAVVSSKGVESTTGGGDGQVVTARTADELADFASRDEPLTILIEGTLTGSGRIEIASNKTLLGVGSSAAISGAELSMSGVSNIIIRNLTIRDARDGIAMRRTHHVWVDHCDLSECGDGLLDITNQSDYVTVSWTRFSKHHKTMLINSGTSHPEDMGTLNTTIHHCWFDGSNTRNPRVGYGKVHVFNCLYRDNGYGIGLHSRARVLAERNYFDKVDNPVQQMYREDPKNPHHGFCEGVDNIFEDCEGERAIEGISFPVEDYYLYDFALDPAASVPDVVEAGAGAAEAFGKVAPLPLPGNGAIAVSVRPQLRWTRGPEAKNYKVAFGETNPPKEAGDTSGQTFDPGTLKPGTLYYWRVDQVTPEGTVEGDVWRFRTLPSQAWFPRPANEATAGASEVLLNWRPGAAATAHRVYLAQAGEPLELASEVERPSYKANGLQYGTTYRWRIDEVTDGGVVQGEPWQFTTKEPLKARPGRVEAETMTRGGYFIETISDASAGAVAAINGQSGWIMYSHQGEDGVYDLTVRYRDETSGASRFRLHVGSEMIAEWQSDENPEDDPYRTWTLKNVRIHKGDEILLAGSWQRGEELARVDWVETTPAGE